MSHEAIAWVKAQYIPSAEQKLVMMAIAHWLDNDTCECVIIESILAKECSMSNWDAGEYLFRLVKGDFVICRRLYNADGSLLGNACSFPGFREWLEQRAKSARDFGRKARESCREDIR